VNYPHLNYFFELFIIIIVIIVHNSIEAANGIKAKGTMERVESSLERVESSLVRLESSSVRVESSLERLEKTMMAIHETLHSINQNIFRLNDTVSNMAQRIPTPEKKNQVAPPSASNADNTTFQPAMEDLTAVVLFPFEAVTESKTNYNNSDDGTFNSSSQLKLPTYSDNSSSDALSHSKLLHVDTKENNSKVEV
jgi:exonuclease VII small subunit